VAIYLVADQRRHFEGRKIWDAMLCLGLQWGDIDCFHWTNVSGASNDYLFSVETSTPPDNFLPQQIVSGQFQANDLIFLFSIPRTWQPTEIATRIEQVVRYCQQRLGGSIRYTVGLDELTMKALLEKVGQIETELKEPGFDPGTDAALRVF